MMCSDIVSVIMPCHNGSRFMQRAIESVIDQSHPGWELLIVDNNSTDHSTEIIGAYCQRDKRVHALSCRTSGAAHARNCAIEAATGRYIAFLDVDDYWASEKLHRQIEFLKTEDLVFSWAAYAVVGEDEQLLRVQKTRRHLSYDEYLAKKGVIGCLTAIYDAQALGKRYMPDIRMRQDFALWLKLLKVAESRGLRCGGLEEPLAYYRTHSGGLTANKFKAAYFQWQAYRNVEGLSMGKAMACFGSYAARGLWDRRKMSSRSTASEKVIVGRRIDRKC